MNHPKDAMLDRGKSNFCLFTLLVYGTVPVFVQINTTNGVKYVNTKLLQAHISRCMKNKKG